jgi:IS4 transposase
MMQAMLERFVNKSPVTVMARAVFEYAMSAERIDELFRQHAVRQYEGQLLFSTAVDLLGLTVSRSRNSLREAYEVEKEAVGVTIKSLYDKLANTELQVSRALVRDTAARLEPIIRSLKAELPPLLPGYRAKILDGKHLGGTEHRLKETRTLNSSPLPGQWLVVLDPQLMLAIDAIPCEDAYTQERKLLVEILPTAEKNDLWVADRNFCTTMFLFGLAEQKASFAIRQHGSTLSGKRLIGKRRRVGRCDTGMVYEQNMEIDDPATGATMTVRRITIELDQPTRDGDTVIHVLTNLPATVDAIKVADIYRKRWTVETAFQELGQALDAEIDTLCYPRAALLAYCIALMMYNTLSVVKASLRTVHGEEASPERISGYYLASEIKAIQGGMMVAITPDQWRRRFANTTPRQMAAFLRDCASHVRIRRFLKNKRGPKRPPPARTGGLREKHVSTARLLAQRTGKTDL